jgi:IS5 family transposase
MERMEFDLLFRWFVGLGVDDPAWDHSSFSKNRDRLLEGEIAAKFLAAVLAQPKVKRLLSSDHFSVDGTLLEAWASIKSFRRKDGDDNDSAGSGRNAERHFHKEKRSNETHRSITDPEARLYRKGDGQPASLCYMGHALMENRHGLVVGGGATLAAGKAEREAALALVDAGPAGSGRRITLGADKAYDVADFVAALRARVVSPHIAIDGHLTKTGKRRRRRSIVGSPATPATRSASAAASASRRCLVGSRVQPDWPRSSCAAVRVSMPSSPWRWPPTIWFVCPSFSEPPHEGQMADRRDAGLRCRHDDGRLHSLRRDRW